MRLADFIAANCDPIVEEWVAFAATRGPAALAMDRTGLRDHAQAMLMHIVADLRTPESDAEQVRKSKGVADSRPEEPDTAAETHAAGRAASGFTLGDMVSEYRALRASVIRLWTKANGTLTGADLEDLMRFNEAIDQATAESITRFTQDLDRSKDMFLAILGHDLRTPIGAVIMSSQFMLDTGELKEPHLTLTTRIAHSARRMNDMVTDLVDLTRSRLGSGIPIVRDEMDLGNAAREAVEETLAAHPDSRIQLYMSGDVRGQWDAGRIGQVLMNLLSNAVQHGSAGTPIRVTVQGGVGEVVVLVHNGGPPIPTSELAGLFSPFKRSVPGTTSPDESHHLGLGLYIADRIIAAHGGTIRVNSAADTGTTFTVCLPRPVRGVPSPAAASARAAVPA